MTAPLPTVRSTIDRIVVEFAGVPHLSFDRSKLIGFQSWLIYDRTKFVIEFTFDSGATITSEYDRREVWEAVLCGVQALFEARSPKAS